MPDSNCVRRCAVVLALLVPGAGIGQEGAPPRPNILWISSEDNGAHLGAYGDRQAKTPNLDALARRGVIYERVWSNAPVCAPARTTIISGLYPTSTGAQHMRSRTRLPQGMSFFPQLLRRAGYYTSNNVKEDYNLEKPGQVWDASSREAHWRKRPAGSPFFSVFNLVVSHESQIRRRPHEAIQDPAAVRLPAYHPDLPEVRRDWAQYYDKMAEVDAAAGRILAELEADGLADSTIVFYWGDHGIGLPRGKRTALDSGLRVPLIVSIPEALRHLAPPGWRQGGTSDRLVGFIDLAPTVLRLAGVAAPPEYQGRAFLGREIDPAPELLFGFRGRMDERIDLVRTVTDGRYVYARNYHPHRPHGQHVAYMFETPTTKVWYAAFLAGELTPAQEAFWQAPRPPEELYDLQTDPDEVRNLATAAAHESTRRRLSEALDRHLVETRDTGFLPEAELRARARDLTPYVFARDEGRYPLAALLRAARLASRQATSAGWGAEATAALQGLLRHAEPGMRYWGALGVLVRARAGGEVGDTLRVAVRGLLDDDSLTPSVPAAEFLVLEGSPEDRQRALEHLARCADPAVASQETIWQALNALDAVDRAALPVRSLLEALPEGSERRRWATSYVPRLLEKLLADLD